MKDHQEDFSVVRMCSVLNVSKSGYYNWLKNKRKVPSKAQLYRQELKQKIRQFFHESFGTYGAPRIHKDLLDADYIVSEKTVGRYMKQLGLRAIPTKKFIQTTDSAHPFRIYKNILKQAFEVESPNEVWVSDITYIWTPEGWVYLIVILDLYARKVIGWQLAENMRKEQAVEALEMALALRKPPKGWIHHSDRGSQYASNAYIALLEFHGAQISMSGKGNPYDNACVESFFATLKKELVYRRKIQTKAEAIEMIRWYITVRYNEKRRHSSNSYVSPNHFERQYYARLSSSKRLDCS